MFKDNLKAIRKAHGLTQKELAAELELSPQRYNYYETGRNEPDYETLKRIATYFGISTDSLLSDGSYVWDAVELTEDIDQYLRNYAEAHNIPREDALNEVLTIFFKEQRSYEMAEDIMNHEQMIKNYINSLPPITSGNSRRPSCPPLDEIAKALSISLDDVNKVFLKWNNAANLGGVLRSGDPSSIIAYNFHQAKVKMYDDNTGKLI